MARSAKKKSGADATAIPAQSQPEPTATQAPKQTVPPQESITISDIQRLVTCVDLAFRRGAFGASEAVEVGQVYNKVAGFLALVAAQQKEAAQEENKNG